MNKRYQNSALRIFSVKYSFEFLMYRTIQRSCPSLFQSKVIDRWTPFFSFYSTFHNCCQFEAKPGQSWWMGHKSSKSHPISDYHTIIVLKLVTVECWYSNCHPPTFSRHFSSHVFRDIHGGHSITTYVRTAWWDTIFSHIYLLDR